MCSVAAADHPPGSAFADYMLDLIGGTESLPQLEIAYKMDSGLIWSVAARLPKVYKALELIRLDHGAFSQLTRQYMTEDFNPRTPDKDGVRYVQHIFLVIERG